MKLITRNLPEGQQDIIIEIQLALPPSSRVSIGPGFRHVMLGSRVKTSEDTGILSHLASSPILI